MKRNDLRKFSKSYLRPHLGAEYFQYKGGDLFRARGPFLQGVLLAIKRSGWLQIIPTFYVVGAMPSYDVIFQSVSLPVSGVDEDRVWLRSPETTLDESLSRYVIENIERESPLSFLEPASDGAIDEALRFFVKKVDHMAPSIFLAFFNLCRGAASTPKDLATAKSIFLKKSRYASGKPPLEYEKLLLDRFNDLEARLKNPDCVHVSRAEADEHAKTLGLPGIEWPEDWFGSVPLWLDGKAR